MRILSVAITSGIAGLGLLVGSNNAQAANLATNGSFETTTGTVPGQLTYNTNVTGWTVPAYNSTSVPYAGSGANGDSYSFLFTPGSADSGGANGNYGNFQLWGPKNGSANGLPATSPDGGNYIAVDSAFQVETGSNATSIQQTLSNLTVGHQYVVSFYDAAAQQEGSSFTSATTDQWKVSLGSQTLNSTAFSTPGKGFSGWKAESLGFTATSPSEVLNFLATGAPDGQPPFLLLDGVSVSVPEPSFNWGLGAVMAFGLSAGLKAKLATKK